MNFWRESVCRLCCASRILNGTESLIETPEATTEEARAGLDTTKLTNDMAGQINALNSTHGCSATVHGNVIHIVRDDGEDFTVKAHDDLGDRASYAIKGWLNDFNDLPPNATEGFRIEIRGDVGDTAVEPYHVVYTEKNTEGEETAGVWKETLKHGADDQIDTATAPLSIKRIQAAENITPENPQGITFNIEATPFSNRTVGDDITAPFPSFVSKQDSDGTINTPRHIQYMIYHKNRLCFVANENLVFSETSEYMNFFPTTVVTTLDADPIDISMNLNDIAPVRHVVINNDTMFLFAPKIQLRVTSGDLFTSATIDVGVASRYQMDADVSPFVHSSVIYFWGKGNRYSTLYEYVPQGDTERYIALELTSHVPHYVTGQLQKTIDSQSENVMMHLTRSLDSTLVNTLYITNVLMRGAERVQNAWQSWTFYGEILDVSLNQDVLTLLIKYGDDLSVEEITLSHDVIKGEIGHSVFLDRREEVDESFVLPDGDSRAVYSHKGRYWVGYRYIQKYVFSEFFMRNEGRPTVGGRLQLRYLRLAFHDTTSFKVEVERIGVDKREVVFEGRVIGNILNILGQVPVVHGEETYPIHTRSDNAQITITNETEHDAVFQTAEWEGTYTRRSRST